MSSPAPIPAGALEHHVAFLGKTGSGKSNAAKVVVEDSLDTGERVCVIDPTGAWWGLRLNRSGKASRYPAVIFGGLHGDVPIGREHGAAVAEVVATSSTPAVIDTRLMTVGERTQFFTAFAQTLLRKNKGPLRLVIDEAHVFAPQGRVADPKSGEMLHAANNLVSLGRSIGLRIMLISQRPAKLHKDSLTQVETLVAMRVIAPQDRKAVEDWIGDQADKDQGKEIIASLPSLKTGDAWVWSPEIGFLERVHFPLARTYDSGKAPTEADGAPELQPLELDEVNALLEKAGEELKANDPRFLKGELARLQRELATAKKPQLKTPDWPDQRDVVARLEHELKDVRGSYADVVERLQHVADVASGLARGIELPRKTESRAKADAPSGVTSAQAPAAGPASRPAGGRSPDAGRGPGGVVAVPEGSTLTGPQRHLLETLAWWAAMGHDQPTRVQLAAKAGWKPRGSNLRNRLSELSQACLVDYPLTGLVRLTTAGAEAAPLPDTSETLVGSIRAVLTGPQLTIFDVLFEECGALSRQELAERIGWEPGGSNLRNRLSELSQLEIVEYPNRGEVRLQDWVQ